MRLFWYIFKHYESYLILLEDAVDEVAGGPINEPIESSKKLLLLPLTFAEVDNLLGLLKQNKINQLISRFLLIRQKLTCAP